MAHEVECREIASHVLGELLEEDALFLQFLEDGLLPVAFLPGLEEGVEARVLLPDRVAGVVAERLGDELAVLAVVLDRSATM